MLVSKVRTDHFPPFFFRLGEFGWPNSRDNYRDTGTFANETSLTARVCPAGNASYFRTLFGGLESESLPIMITWPRKGGVGFTG